MGVRHKAWPLHGVQFHPESFLTVEGPQLLKNFMAFPRRGTSRSRLRCALSPLTGGNSATTAPPA